MTDGIFIRPLADDDWRTLSTIRLEALQDSPRFFGASYETESQLTPDQWKNWLKPHRQAVFALLDAETPIGMTGLMTNRENPSEGLCIASYIQPAYRGRGLSKLLYKVRIDWALNYLQWKKLIVSHREGNEASRRANGKWGFVRTKEELKSWPDGTTENEIIYELDLEPLRKKQ